MGTSRQTNTVPAPATPPDQQTLDFQAGLAKFLGKVTTDPFTEADLTKLLDAFFGSVHGIPIIGDFVYNTFHAYFEGWVGQPINHISPNVDYMRAITTGVFTSVSGGNPDPSVGVLDSTSTALGFLTNPHNWLLILGAFGGILLLVIGGRKAMDGGQ